jgi:DNA-binding NtrC family response regulator
LHGYGIRGTSEPVATASRFRDFIEEESGLDLRWVENTPFKTASWGDIVGENNESLILLVDDDNLVADLLSSWLTAAGLKSVVASNGREAIDKFRLMAFSAVVLDVDLGVAPDGFGVLEDIRRENLDIPVIMMSGTANVHVREDAIQRGACAFLFKPFDPESLLHLIAASTCGAKVAEQASPLAAAGSDER